MRYMEILLHSKESKVHVKYVDVRCKLFLPLRAFLIELKWKEKQQSVSERIHYVIRDLGMDQLLQSVGMPVIDSAHADVTRHSSHTSLSIWSVCNAAAMRESGTLCCIMLLTQSCIDALWALITQAHIYKGCRDRELTSFETRYEILKRKNKKQIGFLNRNNLHTCWYLLTFPAFILS